MNFFKILQKASQHGTRQFHQTPLRMGFLDCSPNGSLNKTIADRYMCLPLPDGCVQVSYVFVDGHGPNVCMKSRTFDFVPSTYKDCPNWIFDGSSLGFAKPDKSDCYLVPVALYNDPFRRGNNKIVLCETFSNEKKPTPSNHRQCCVDVLNKVCDQEPHFGFEQEFYFVGMDEKPFGYPRGIFPGPLGKSYCQIGSHSVAGREIVECAYRCGLYAGLNVTSYTAERAFAQWEMNIGPCLSIKAADDLLVLRYLLQMLAEMYALDVSFKSVLPGTMIPSGLHTIMSTKQSRDNDGIGKINEYVQKLGKRHSNDLQYFDAVKGKHLKDRLTGQNNTSQCDRFTSGVGNRTASVLIPSDVRDKKKGHLEDRRPSACADPYNVIMALANSCLL